MKLIEWIKGLFHKQPTDNIKVDEIECVQAEVAGFMYNLKGLRCKNTTMIY